MATKPHVQDNSVAERRLRPIYEWLDGGYNKKALQETEKVLRKTPNLQCARALKALALLRLNKETECIALLDALNLEKPTDDPTLQAMTICYRELHQYDRVCALYETAIRVEPTNEELHTHLFMSYVRILDYKQQQQSAMALYKMKNKNPYYLWAVMSVVLQATRDITHDANWRQLLLSLAERMIDKLLNENRIEAEQEVQLYLMILKLQDKNEEALKLLDNPLGSRLLTGATTHAKIPFLINLKRWRQLNTLTAKMLIENTDLWDIWQHYLRSVFELMKIKTSGVEDENNVGDSLSVDDSPEKCHDFICTLMECCTSSGPHVRGPSLARLELYNMMGNHNCDPKQLLGDYLELLVEYFRKFGHKPCCVYDIKVYLKFLPLERRCELSSRLLKDVGINSTTLPQSEQQMQRHISSLQISRMCGAHENLTNTHLVAFVIALALHYQHGVTAYGSDILPTNTNPSDPYALLSAHVLFDLSQREQSSTPLILALTLLENVIKASPNNHHAKILCIRLYQCLGAGLAAHDMYETLDIKHIQLDSMAFIHCTLLPVTGPMSVNTQLWNATTTFFSVNYKDTADHLTFSYKFGSFLKLEELLDFRERLNNSLHKITAITEKTINDLVQCNSLQSISSLDLSLKGEATNYKNIRDNRDLSVIVCYDPITLSDDFEKENQEIFKQDIEVVRLRTALCHYIIAAVQAVSIPEAGRSDAINRISQYKEAYNSVYTDIKKSNYQPLIMNRLTAHFPSRLHEQMNAPYREVLESYIDLIQSLLLQTDDITLRLIETAKNEFQSMCKNICEIILTHKDSEDYNFIKRKTIARILIVAEIASLASLLCTGCCELTKPAQGKKGKKKGAVNSNNVVWLQMQGLVTAMKGSMESIDEALQAWWSPTESTANLTDRLGALSLADGLEQSILTKLNVSHILLVKELQNLLKDKLKLIGSFCS